MACSQGSHQQATNKPPTSLRGGDPSLHPSAGSSELGRMVLPWRYHGVSMDRRSLPLFCAPRSSPVGDQQLGNRQLAMSPPFHVQSSMLDVPHNPQSSILHPLPLVLLPLDKPHRQALDSTVSAISLSSCRLAFVSRAPCAGRIPAASTNPPASSRRPPVSSFHPCPSTLNFLRPAGRGNLGLLDLSLPTCARTAQTSSRAGARTFLSAQPPARYRPRPTAWFSASSDRNYPLHSIWRLRHDFPIKPPYPDVLPLLGQTSGQPYC